MISNELLWIMFLFINLGMILLAYKLFGKLGLYVWTAMAVILANIQVLKTVQLFGYVTAMGNIIYSSTFLVTDILSEKYSYKDAHKAVWIGFFVLLATTIIMQLSLLFVPDASDFSQGALQTIFGFLPRIVAASIIAYLVSQNLDVFLFKFWKKLFPKYLWIRNNLSTMISQLVDNLIFTFIAFVGFLGLPQVFGWPIIIQIFLVSYIMKFVVAILDTPFLYWAKKIDPGDKR